MQQNVNRVERATAVKEKNRERGTERERETVARPVFFLSRERICAGA